jgi:hypothetical protein
MVRDKVRDKVGYVPWNAEFRHWETGRSRVTARQDRRFLTRGGVSPERSCRTVEPESHEVA